MVFSLNATYNILAEEGQNPGPEPPQPGLLRRIGQNVADSAREGAINQAGQIGAAMGAGAVTLAGQALQRVGGAVRDGAVQYGQDFLDLYWRGRLPGGPLAEPLLGAAEGAEIAAGLGAVEGAELGVFGGPVGMLAGAAIGAATSTAAATLAFRDRESTERQDHYLDVRSLNNGNESVRPIRPRFFAQALDDRVRNLQEALRPRTQYYSMDAQDRDIFTEFEVEPGRAQEPLRPTAVRTPMQPRLTAQGVVDSIAASQPSAPEQIRLQRRAARNRLPPGESQGPPGSYQDIMRATAAPTGGSSGSSQPFGINASAPALPAPGRNNRRNKGRIE